MTLENINYIAQIFGAVAIFGSLIFVGIQVRQNTAMSRAEVHQQLSDTFTTYLETLSNHSSIVFGAINSRAGLEKLSDEELLRFSFLMVGLFKIWENAYYQHQNGFLTARNWQSNVNWMLTWYHMPGIQIWWRVRKDLFAEEFQAFLEASSRPADERPLSARLREAAEAEPPT